MVGEHRWAGLECVKTVHGRLLPTISGEEVRFAGEPKQVGKLDSRCRFLGVADEDYSPRSRILWCDDAMGGQGSVRR